MRGTIFAIEEFSVYDGPGIRTSVFLKGCPLRCSWCHNPEGQEPMPQIVRSPNGCLACGRCEDAAVRHGEGLLVFTEESIARCPRGLLRVCGEEIDSHTLCERVRKNERLLVGGGVTFSGGEPLVQPDFLCAALEELHGTLHTAVQTSGFATQEVFDRVLSLADYFLYDLKILSDDLHRCYTGVSNRPILSNFSRLAASGKPFMVRVPLIPGVTDTERNLTEIAEWLRAHSVNEIELLPYNRMAGGKYKMLSRTYDPRFDESVAPNARPSVFDAYGITTRIL